MLGQGVRLPWSDVPAEIRTAIGGVAGAPVVAAETCVGGFSPGLAARLTLADGGVVFAKAVSTAQNPDTPDSYRREAAVNAWLPDHPALPRLLGTYDDGDWVALVFEHVDAAPPPLPWRTPDLAAVLAALTSVQAAATPVPADALRVEAAYGADFSSWRSAAAAPPAGLDAWSRTHLDRLAGLEAGWAAAAEGDALLHADLRADNVLVGHGRAWLVDWPWACAGAAWVDGVLMAPSVSMQGGPPPEDVLAAAYPDAPVDGVVAVLAALAGFFTLAALEPAPQGLPTLRAHQASSGLACRTWLARLLGLPAPA